MFRAAFSLRFVLLAAACALLGACTPAGLVLSAAGVATDTSVTWDVVKHLHGKLTEDSPKPCILLNPVQRALNARCDYEPGRIKPADFATAGLQECPVAVATRDPRLWRALPELMAQGAKPEACAGSPLAALAAAEPCPDFASAAPSVRAALVSLAENDPRAVRHDVFRMLGCPRARAVGMDRVLLTWLDRGDLEPGKLSFSPFDAADPDLLVTRFGRELEVAGHRPEGALDGYDGVLPSGFEAALKASHWQALDWWLYRLPQLANLAPAQRGGFAWVPLQRVLRPGYLLHPESQGEMVAFLMARGASPGQRLPSEPQTTVLGYATQMKSPMLAVLDPPPMRGNAATTVTALGGAAMPGAAAGR